MATGPTKGADLRGDEGALSNFSVELLEDGFRAIDPMARLRYVVRRAPDDAPLSSPGAAPEEAVSPPPAADEEGFQRRQPAPTVGFSSMGQAVVQSEAAVPPAPDVPRKRAPAQTMAFSSSGAAAIRDAAAISGPGARALAVRAAEAEKALEAISAAQAAVSARKTPPPAAPPDPAVAAMAEPAAASRALPSFEVVSAREENPSERSPLSYREFVYAVAQGTTDESAGRLIVERFESVRAGLDGARPGKLINLAIFDHVFRGRPLRRPLVTLTWKDWKNEAPEVLFPRRDGPPSNPPPPGAEGSVELSNVAMSPAPSVGAHGSGDAQGARPSGSSRPSSPDR